MERVVGPIERHFVAAYTVPATEGHYGYAKISTARPQTPWDAVPAVLKVAAGPYPSEQEALEAAIEKAADTLRGVSDFQVLWGADDPP